MAKRSFNGIKHNAQRVNNAMWRSLRTRSAGGKSFPVRKAQILVQMYRSDDPARPGFRAVACSRSAPATGKQIREGKAPKCGYSGTEKSPTVAYKKSVKSLLTKIK